MRIASNVEMLEISGMGSVIHPVLLRDDDNLALKVTGPNPQHTHDMDLAMRLYDKVGFVLTEGKVNHEWSNTEIVEQKMELKIV